MKGGEDRVKISNRFKTLGLSVMGVLLALSLCGFAAANGSHSGHDLIFDDFSLSLPQKVSAKISAESDLLKVGFIRDGLEIGGVASYRVDSTQKLEDRLNAGTLSFIEDFLREHNIMTDEITSYMASGSLYGEFMATIDSADERAAGIHQRHYFYIGAPNRVYDMWFDTMECDQNQQENLLNGFALVN